MMIRSITHLLHTLMTRSNIRNNGNKGAVHIREPNCNALVVAHKYEDSLPIKVVSSYKRKGNQRYTQKFIQKLLPSQFLSKNPFFLWLNHWSVFGKHHIGVLYPHFESYCKFCIKDVFNLTSSINRDEELKCWFLASSPSIMHDRISIKWDIYYYNLVGDCCIYSYIQG